MDVSIKALKIAADRLHLEDLPPALRQRVELMHGSLMYHDRRLEGFDAAVVVEVVEHLDEPRLRAFERVVFEFARPKTIALTTPNREYNIKWEKIGTERLRHKDQRFEWTREEFKMWSTQVARKTLVALARKYHALPIAIIFDLPEKICQVRNRERPDRNLGKHVIRQQRSQLRRSLGNLKREGFRQIVKLSTEEKINSASIERVPLWNDKRELTGNHDTKLLRKLRGKDVQITHGLADSLKEIEALPPEICEEFKQSAAEFLDRLISHYTPDGGKLVVAHAGLKKVSASSIPEPADDFLMMPRWRKRFWAAFAARWINPISGMNSRQNGYAWIVN